MTRILLLVAVLSSFIFIKAQNISESTVKKESSQSYYNGVKYFFEGNILKAEENFQTALKIKPNDLNTLKYLAEISIAKQNLQMIEYYYEKVLELNSDNEDALISLGVINLNKGIFEKAEILLVKAVNIQPYN